MVLQSGEDESQMLQMSRSIDVVDKNVIEEDDYELSQVVFEDDIHGILKVDGALHNPIGITRNL